MTHPTVKSQPVDQALSLGKPFYEAFELWKAGCEVWLDYLNGLQNLRTPDAVLHANAKLWASTLQICGLASGALLEDEGIKAPTLDER